MSSKYEDSPGLSWEINDVKRPDVKRAPVRTNLPLPVYRPTRPKVINIQIPDSFAEDLNFIAESDSPSPSPSPNSSYPSSRSCSCSSAHSHSPWASVFELRQPFSLQVCEFCEHILKHRIACGDLLVAPYYLSHSLMEKDTHQNKSRAAARRLEQLLVEIRKYSACLDRGRNPRDFLYFQEKRKCQRLLYEMLPKMVVQQLLHGNPVRIKTYKSITVCFCDVEDLSDLTAVSTPVEMIDFLKKVYSAIDELLVDLDVNKVETIYEAYVAVSGLPVRNGSKHAANIADMALRVIDTAAQLEMPHLNRRLRLRVGIHSGICAAGVIGSRLPRYCIFGDTINVASLLTAAGRAQKILVSRDTKRLLEQHDGYYFELHGSLYSIEQGRVITYFLHRRKQSNLEVCNANIADPPKLCIRSESIADTSSNPDLYLNEDYKSDE